MLINSSETKTVMKPPNNKYKFGLSLSPFPMKATISAIKPRQNIASIVTRMAERTSFDCSFLVLRWRSVMVVVLADIFSVR